MARRTVQILDRQTLVDVAIREHGSVEGLFQLTTDDTALDNITVPVAAGDLIKVRLMPIDKDVAEFYKANKLWPITGPLLPPQFVCVGPGNMPITLGGFAILTPNYGVGYSTLRIGPTRITQEAVQVPSDPGAYCFYMSDELGEPSGVPMTALDLNGEVLEADFSNLPDLEFVSGTVPMESVDFSNQLAMVELYWGFPGLVLLLTNNGALEILSVVAPNMVDPIDLTTLVNLFGLYLDAPLMPTTDFANNTAMVELSIRQAGPTLNLSAQAAMARLELLGPAIETVTLHPDALLKELKSASSALTIDAANALCLQMDISPLVTGNFSFINVAPNDPDALDRVDAYVSNGNTFLLPV